MGNERTGNNGIVEHEKEWNNGIMGKEKKLE
jgi:hypothetical protein